MNEISIKITNSFEMPLDNDEDIDEKMLIEIEWTRRKEKIAYLVSEILDREKHICYEHFLYKDEMDYVFFLVYDEKNMRNVDIVAMSIFDSEGAFYNGMKCRTYIEINDKKQLCLNSY